MKKVFRNRAQVYIYFFLILYVSATYFVLLANNSILEVTVLEDGFFEWLTAGALFVTTVLYVVMFVKSRRSEEDHRLTLREIVYLAFALLFFFGAGEEISWGQRIFAFDTPESLATINVQDEVTFHNIFIFGPDGTIGAHTLFSIFVFSYTLGIPLLAELVKPLRDFISKFIPVVPWLLGIPFVVNYVVYKIFRRLAVPYYSFERTNLSQARTEIKESNYAVLLLFVAIYILHVMLQEKTAEEQNPPEF